MVDHGQRIMTRRARVLRAFFRLPGSRTFGVLLATFFVVVVLGVAVLAARYQSPLDGGRMSVLDAIYAVFTMLTFETAYPLPRDGTTAVVFFVVPLMGLLLLGNGLVRVGRALFDRAAWETAMASTYENHIVVCGLGKVGYRVIRWLVQLGSLIGKLSMFFKLFTNGAFKSRRRIAYPLVRLIIYHLNDPT